MTEIPPLRANAKINLFLAIRGRRDDGYHDIETVFQSVSLADEVLVERAPVGVVSIEMHPASTQVIDMPATEDNIVTKALLLLAHAADHPVGAAVTIAKSIPVAAGLAGGSADAAAALMWVNEMLPAPLDTRALLEVAAATGSDVPFCMIGGTALGTGRGERLERLRQMELHLVLGLSGAGLLTRDVYARVDSSAVASDPGAMLAALAEEDPHAVGAALHNDLEEAAFALAPPLREGKAALLRAGALGALVSGSGPTLFGVARDRDHAVDIAPAVEEVFDRVEVVTSRGAGVEQALP